MSKQDDFTRVFAWVLGALVLFTIIVFLLARTVGMDDGSKYMTDADIRERIKPYGGSVVTGQPKEKAEEEVKEEAQKPAPAMQKPAEMAEKAAEPAVAETVAKVEAAPEAAAIDAQKLYMQACMACHLAGVAEAPKLTDKAAWAPRIATGIDALVQSAINGKNAMPPKGGRMDFSDEQIRAVVEYMVSQAQ